MKRAPTPPNPTATLDPAPTGTWVAVPTGALERVEVTPPVPRIGALVIVEVELLIGVGEGMSVVWTVTVLVSVLVERRVVVNSSESVAVAETVAR